ncbi:MAG TPA: MBL fold metallo-hydrolase [Oscillospiraceae bacterium]|nr:MBL fold metallo-hydrolase [Oscillospiraceae bacterium]HNW04638.1 MBL fold metallo-hydrolase [Oscillospiraceae bacterium]HPW00636.1 MBL fold metallo-hydrolase [Oscillospiraceae bacterium]
MTVTEITVGIMRTNCYVVESEQKNAVVIDPGDEGDRLTDRLTNLGVKVRYIFLTHAHFDHTGAVKEVQKRFPEAKVVLMKADEEILLDPSLVVNRVQGKFGERYHIKPDLFVSDGEILKLDELSFVFIATPGHTKGSCTILLCDQLFTGDTLFAGMCGRTDLYGGSQSDMKRSLARLGNLEGDYEILPGHGPGSTLAIERFRNSYLRSAMGKEVL